MKRMGMLLRERRDVTTLIRPGCRTGSDHRRPSEAVRADRSRSDHDRLLLAAVGDPGREALEGRKPPVRAAGAASPPWTSVLKWVAATVEAIATPTAPPTCWAVLRMPEARPASASDTPASPAIDTGMKANAVPAPVTKNGPARSF